MTAAADVPHPPRLFGADWLSNPSARAVFAALAAGGHEARAVGGAVRNALFGKAVKDVDIATTATPEETMRLARAAGLKAHPTGIEHGTITVVAGHEPYEVTTLRRDIETFGRHARVTFTTDWTEDAKRRDFTMNALYCAADGTIHDPLGGYPDLAARRVRFIGDPHERIREDFLRILRFFRLYAEYGRGEPDPTSLDACVAERAGLANLSGERIRAEFLRMLAAPGAVDAAASLAIYGILEPLHLHLDPHLLARLVEIETALGRPPDPVLRLTALLLHKPGDVEHLKTRLRLSSNETETLALVAGHHPHDSALDPLTSERTARVGLYRMGVRRFELRALLAWTRSPALPDDPARRQRLALPDRWPPPPLPFSGRDVLALGIPAGRAVGEALARFENWWVDADFPSGTDQLHDALARAVQGP